VTFAPATEAPLWSVIFPTIRPVASCAFAPAPKKVVAILAATNHNKNAKPVFNTLTPKELEKPTTACDIAFAMPKEAC
jgi:hypothetical protein